MMIVFLVVFIDLLGFGIVLPMLPLIAQSYLGAVIKYEFAIGPLNGLLLSSFSLMQFLFAPMWGRFSDRVGRRPILLIGLVGSVIFYSVFGYAASLPAEQYAALALLLFYVARFGAGISGATIATAQAVIADSTPPEKRKHGMALIGAAFGIGFTFGPLIGAGCMWISDHYSVVGKELIGYTAAGLSLIALVLGFFLLPETRFFTDAPPAQRRLLDFSAIQFALRNAAIGPVILTFFLSTLGFSMFEATLAVYLADTFQFPQRTVFQIFAYVGVSLIIAQGLLYRRLASRLSEITFMAIGIVFMALGVVMLGSISFSVSAGLTETTAHTLLFVALTAAVVGFAFLTPSAQALISRRTPDDRQGEVLGINQSSSAMARIIGPILGMTLYTSTEGHLLPYFFGGAIIIIMLPILPLIRRGGTEDSAI